LCAPQGSPGGDGHQSEGDRPQSTGGASAAVATAANEIDISIAALTILVLDIGSSSTICLELTV